MMYSWMKFVEVAPERYDWAVTVMTVGKLDHIKDCIADTIEPGERVLDIGCGTGTLAVRCLKRGAHVTGLDSSAFMLQQAQKNAMRHGLSQHLILIKDSVTQLHKHFESESFDVVMSTMTFGEFPREYLHYILRNCMCVLRSGGRLIIADEVWPERLFPQLLFRLIMVIFWMPQFLLLRRVFFPIRNLREIIQAAGFQVTKLRTWPGSSFQLVFAERPGAQESQFNTTSAVTDANATV